MDDKHSDTKLVKEYGWIYDTTAINELQYISYLIFEVNRYSIITFYLDMDMDRNITLKDTAKRVLSKSSNNHPSASKLDTSKKISLDKNCDDDDDIDLCDKDIDSISYNFSRRDEIDNSSSSSDNSHDNGSSHSSKSSSKSYGSSCSSGGSSCSSSSSGSSCGSSCGS
jgi:uncharacterized membrane protein YgcG